MVKPPYHVHTRLSPPHYMDHPHVQSAYPNMVLYDSNTMPITYTFATVDTKRWAEDYDGPGGDARDARDARDTSDASDEEEDAADSSSPVGRPAWWSSWAAHSDNEYHAPVAAVLCMSPTPSQVVMVVPYDGVCSARARLVPTAVLNAVCTFMATHPGAAVAPSDVVVVQGPPHQAAATLTWVQRQDVYDIEAYDLLRIPVWDRYIYAAHVTVADVESLSNHVHNCCLHGVRVSSFDRSIRVRDANDT